ncbi:MAG: hypothetical protein AAGK47_06655 [Bacteroidota bacterium]
MNQQNFDNWVRDKLTGLSVSQDADSWDSFTKKWETEADDANNGSSVTAFDRLIQDRISQLATPVTSEVWSLFEQKRATEADTPHLEEHVMDEIVYRKLRDYSIADDAGQWEKLVAKWRQQQWQSAKVIVYKSMELLIVLLLVIGGQYMLFPPMHGDDVPTVQQLNPPIATVLDSVTTAAKDSNASSAKKTASKQQSAIGIAPLTVLQNKAERLELVETPAPAILSNVSTAMVEFADQKQAPPTDDLRSRYNLSPLKTPLRPLQYRQTHLPSSTEPVEPLENRYTAAIASSQALAPVALLHPEKKRATRFGIIGLGAIDRIFTPIDHLFLIGAYDRYSPGYGGGFSIGRAFFNQRWEIETAMLYVSKRYSQQVVVSVVGGSLRNGYNVAPTPSYIEMNIVQIPLHIRYNIINTNKWNVYGLGGFSLQLILQANYDRADLGASAQFAPISLDGNIQQPIIHPSKKFNNGFLADKKFSDNRYYNYNIGLGLERFVSPRWSIFAQPTYQHTINVFNPEGIGPNEDRINTMMLLLGAKVGL